MTFLSQDGIGQNLLDGGPILGFATEALPNELPQFLADSSLEAHFLSLHLLQQLLLIRALPRRLLVQHLVQHHSKGEHIRSKTVHAALQRLDAHVEGRPQVEDLPLRQFASLHCEPEVSQLALPALDQDVLALYVPVHHSRLPESPQRQRNLPPKDLHCGFGQSLGSQGETAEEVTALAELTDDEAEGSSVEDVQEFDCVGGVAGSLAAHLIVEEGLLFGSAEELAVHHLHADQLVSLSVDPHVGLPAHAAPDLLVDAELVTAEALHRTLLRVRRAGSEWDGGFGCGLWLFAGGGGVGLIFRIF